MKRIVALYHYFPLHNQQRNAVVVKTLQHTAQNMTLASQQYEMNYGCTCPFNVSVYGLSFYQIEGCMLWFCDDHNAAFEIILSFFKGRLIFWTRAVSFYINDNDLYDNCNCIKLHQIMLIWYAKFLCSVFTPQPTFYLNFFCENTFSFPSVRAGKKKPGKWMCCGLGNRTIVLFRFPECARDLSLLQGFQNWRWDHLSSHIGIRPIYA
jgi:hypothetical protein